MRVALLCLLVGLALGMAANASRRASQPNPVNGSVRVLSEVAR
jgi:hypothetical protein